MQCQRVLLVVCWIATNIQAFAQFWRLGTKGANCITTCANMGWACSESSWPTSASDFQSILDMSFSINNPCTAIFKGGEIYNPSRRESNGECYYFRNSSGYRCHEVDNAYQRFCPCEVSTTTTTSTSTTNSTRTTATTSTTTTSTSNTTETTTTGPLATASGSFSFNLVGTTLTQVDSSARAALAQYYQVTPNAVTVNVTGSRRLGHSAFKAGRRLAGFWAVQFTIKLPESQAQTVIITSNSAAGTSLTIILKQKLIQSGMTSAAVENVIVLNFQVVIVFGSTMVQATTPAATAIAANKDGTQTGVIILATAIGSCFVLILTALFIVGYCTLVARGRMSPQQFEQVNAKLDKLQQGNAGDSSTNLVREADNAQCMHTARTSNQRPVRPTIDVDVKPSLPGEPEQSVEFIAEGHLYSPTRQPCSPSHLRVGAATPHNLPPGWDKATSRSTGMVYYFNRTTGETSWDPPKASWTPRENSTPQTESAPTSPTSNYKPMTPHHSRDKPMTPHHSRETTPLPKWMCPTCEEINRGDLQNCRNCNLKKPEDKDKRSQKEDRGDLDGKKGRELKRLAKELGASDEEYRIAEDSAEVREEFIQLILKLRTQVRSLHLSVHKDRPGFNSEDEDVKKVAALLGSRNHEVVVDPDRHQIWNKLTEFKDGVPASCVAVVIFISAHGESSCVKLADDTLVDRAMIQSVFSPAAWPKCGHVPKMFFVQCCRVNETGPTFIDNATDIERIDLGAPANFLIAHSAFRNQRSNRGVMFSALRQALERGIELRAVSHILTEVKNRVNRETKGGQTMVVEDTLLHVPTF